MVYQVIPMALDKLKKRSRIMLIIEVVLYVLIASSVAYIIVS